MGETELSQKNEIFGIIKEILNAGNGISYEKISQILAEEFFLNPLNYTFKEKYNDIKLIEFLYSLISPSLPIQPLNIDTN
jgi:hypothetical protein